MVRKILAAGTSLAAGVALAVAPDVASGAGPASGWVNGWQGSPVQGGTIPGASCPADKGLDAQTIRNVVFVSVGGDALRVRLANTFGATPLRVGAASVALAGSGAATRGPVHQLHFGGRASVLLAAGGEALSDPVRMTVPALTRLDVSVYLPTRTGPATQHWDAQQDNYLASGNRTAATTASGFGTTVSCWMFAAGVDVHPAPASAGRS